MMEKTKGPNDKGAGVHLDIVLLSAINMFTGRKHISANCIEYFF